MPETTTVRLKGKIHEWGRSLEHAPEDVVYVGRLQYMGGWQLRASQFANPYRAQQVGGAAKAVELYAAWLAERPHLVAVARSMLRGKRLACWCKPGQPCHAVFLADLADGRATLPEPRADFGEGRRDVMPQPAYETVRPAGQWAGAL